MALVIPPEDTPARQAMLDQGKDFYPGVDKWDHPTKGLPAGKMLVQFDHRDADIIQAGIRTSSVYFTDAETFMKYLTADNRVQAQGLGEALQVGPRRLDETVPHLYSKHVAMYALQRELRAADILVAQPAEFGEGFTRSNLHWGEGVGKQFFVAYTKEQLVAGPDPILKLAGIFPCDERGHRLDWMQALEKKNAPDTEVQEAVDKVFNLRAKQLLQGTPEQQQQGREIKELRDITQQLRGPVPAFPTPKIAAVTQADPATRKRNRAPRF